MTGSALTSAPSIKRWADPPICLCQWAEAELTAPDSCSLTHSLTYSLTNAGGGRPRAPRFGTPVALPRLRRWARARSSNPHAPALMQERGRGGIRTPKPFRATDFKSVVSAVPPLALKVMLSWALTHLLTHSLTSSLVMEARIGIEPMCKGFVPRLAQMEAAIGIEPMCKGFADPRLTTWLRRHDSWLARDTERSRGTDPRLTTWLPRHDGNAANARCIRAPDIMIAWLMMSGALATEGELSDTDAAWGRGKTNQCSPAD